MLNDVESRVAEIAKMLDGKISCWQDNELYWCLKTILNHQEQLDQK